jgi:putative FmdB family regulatory protein
MPLYEYQCDACGRRFELIRKFSDPPLEECPHCGGTVRKLFSSPAIQFKGSGFYITDYAKKDQAPASPPGEAKSDTASKDKDTGEKSGAKSEKTEKTEKSEGASQGDKAAAKTESAPASASKAPTGKDGT